ncbi:hypothetical protein [Kaistella jeonii]|uniref:hypothetical protein n=1 Tax=Kaistella jeonii TaxID=266749 RepID=UPI00068D4691|nr:hypothetical protein [Kaistella jeonii]SFB95019.1 hypothetical protein SAMN05421876_10488 [Kaistella jeonii]VEI97123.1 Uncharacterised protein [Kaistella jeonii]
MIHRIIISTFGFLALATCKNQTFSQNSNTSEKTEIATKTTVSTPKSTPVKTTNNSEPEMSTGMPPDKAAVKQAEKEASAKVSQSGVIYLKEGENKFLKEYEMNVTFKKMLEDSRCPEGVNCIWAGVATAEVEVMGLATRPTIIKISTMDDSSRGYADSQDFNGYQITLSDVSPNTTSDRGFKALQGKYKIGIKIKKLAPGQTSPNSPTTK